MMRRPVQLLSLAYLLTARIGATVAIKQNLPGEFAGRTSGRSASGDFFTGTGTALSPPLAMLLLQGVLTALSLGRGRAEEVGLGGLTVLGGGATVGMLGEPITYRALSPKSFDPPKAALVLALIALPLRMAILALRQLLAYRARH